MDHRCINCAKRKECKIKRISKSKINNCEHFIPDQEKYARLLRAKLPR